MLSIIIVVGVAACNLWRWKGVAVSSAILAAIMIYALQSQASHSWVWTITLSLTIASTFVLNVLCIEEAQQALSQYSKDSTDHKHSIFLLNEKLQIIQAKLTSEQNEFKIQKEKWQEQLTAKEEKQKSNEQLIKLARKEITNALEKQEKLLQELYQSSKKNEYLEAKIVELQNFINNKVTELNDQFAQEKASLKEASQELAEMMAIQKEVIEIISSDKALLMKQIHEKENAKEEVNPTQEQQNLFSLYHQLKRQFEEKSQTLAATRKELFLTQEKLLALQKDNEEAQLDEGKEVIKAFYQFSSQVEKEFSILEQEHVSEIDHLHELIGFYLK